MKKDKVNQKHQVFLLTFVDEIVVHFEKHFQDFLLLVFLVIKGFQIANQNSNQSSEQLRVLNQQRELHKGKYALDILTELALDLVVINFYQQLSRLVVNITRK